MTAFQLIQQSGDKNKTKLKNIIGPHFLIYGNFEINEEIRTNSLHIFLKESVKKFPFSIDAHNDLA